MFCLAFRRMGLAFGLLLIPFVSRLCVVMSLLACAIALPGATLERLTLDDVANQSTAVIRGKVSSSYTAVHGATIYTHYRVQVEENWKGASGTTVDVMLPGGIANGVRESYAGIPQLTIGKEYVMFLWTGPSGRTQLTGLTQGLFDVSMDATGQPLASRGVSSELMLDARGKAVQDQPIRMSLKDMTLRVKGAAGSSVK